MVNFPLFQKEPAKQFQIVALARSFLSETGFFDRKREKNRRKKNIFRMANFPLFQKEPAKQFQIVALARSFLAETGFFGKKREKKKRKRETQKVGIT